MPSRAAIDQLGERLRAGIGHDDLIALDAYRRSFQDDYDRVVAMLRNDLGVDVSGRPAKSTPAIVAKLRRNSMRLSQMQDVAGCRVVVADLRAQDELIARIANLGRVSIADRRTKPSHGYRAVHVILQSGLLPVEIQVRTELQHLWSELSEKASDRFGIEVKYGGGPKSIVTTLNAMSVLTTLVEQAERLLHKMSSIGPETHLEIEGIKSEHRDLHLKIDTDLNEQDSELATVIQDLRRKYELGKSEFRASRQDLLDRMRGMIERLGGPP